MFIPTYWQNPGLSPIDIQKFRVIVFNVLYQVTNLVKFKISLSLYFYQDKMWQLSTLINHVKQWFDETKTYIANKIVKVEHQIIVKCITIKKQTQYVFIPRNCKFLKKWKITWLEKTVMFDQKNRWIGHKIVVPDLFSECNFHSLI